MSGRLVVSARAVQYGAEQPLMDALAHGFAEQRMIYNRDGEVDSLAELIPHLTDGIEEHELQLLAALCEGLHGHNLEQLRSERTVIGWANALVGDLHALELTGAQAQELLGVRAIAARLRGPLEVLLTGGEVLEIVDAVRAVDAVLTRAPRTQIFRPSLENLLGGRKYRLLCQLDERRREAQA